MIKYVSSKVIKETKRCKHYEIIIRCSDYDIEMMEDFGYLSTIVITGPNGDAYNERHSKFLRRLYHQVFQRLWREHDN